jgi:hypothetical protein
MNNRSSPELPRITELPKASMALTELKAISELDANNLLRGTVVEELQRQAYSKLLKILEEETTQEQNGQQVHVPAPLPVGSYHNFDIKLYPVDGDRLRVEVLYSPFSGEATDTEELPVCRMANLDPDAVTRHLIPCDDGPEVEEQALPSSLEALGTEIGKALLPKSVRQCFEKSLNTASINGDGLRVRLRAEHETISAIPWELARLDEDYLSLRQATPLVRYVEADYAAPSLATSEQLRILGVVSDPENMTKLDTNREKQNLEKALEHLISSRRVNLSWLPRADTQPILNALRSKPHIIHYIGHASYDKKNKACKLWLKNKAGTAKPLTPNVLTTLLRDSGVRLVFLNACQSSYAVGGLTEALVRRGVPAALGMQTTVLDEIAIEFATSFYRALSDGWPVDACLAHARLAVASASEGDLERPHWAQPVLHMRAPNGQLFWFEEPR